MGALATHAVNVHLYRSIPFDPVRDFAPVTLISEVPNILVVHPAVPEKTLPEFVAHARANPGRLNFGSGSTGSAGHLAGELFNTMTGARMVHIPYKGAAPALNELMGGRIAAVFDSLTLIMPQAKAGRVRALGIASREIGRAHV